MIYLAFRLSMPSCGSWDGKWSGAAKFYAITKSFQRNRRAELEKIINKDFRYSFGDGWVASVDVMEVDSKEANVIKKKSAGFCGYEWMVDSILLNGKIIVREREAS